MQNSHYVSPDRFDTLPGLLQAWRGLSPSAGVLALVPEAESARVPAIQRCCRELGLPLAGAVFPALVTDDGFVNRGAWLLCLDPMPPCFLLGDMAADAEAPAQRLADAVEAILPADAEDLPPKLFLIFDSMVPDIGSVLFGMYQRVLSRAFYGGVNAGSETFQPMPCLFDADRLVGNGVLGLLFPPAWRMLAEHAYPVSKAMFRATSASGNRIDSIDGRPAFDVYCELIRSEYGVEVTRDNFYQYAVHFPFGVPTALDVLVRIPVALGDDGSLFCVGEIPSGSTLRLLRAPETSDSACIDALARAATGEAMLTPMPVFYCAGRRMHFGVDAAAREIGELRRVLSPAGVVGALSLGEIDSDNEIGMPRFHNATILCLR